MNSVLNKKFKYINGEAIFCTITLKGILLLSFLVQYFFLNVFVLVKEVKADEDITEVTSVMGFVDFFYK